MKSEWKVREVTYKGRSSWEVYRLLCKDEPISPWNKETLMMDYETREEAEAMAAKLNTEEKAK